MLNQIAHILGRLGGELLAWRADGPVNGSWQGSQLKTKADRAAHRFLSSELACLDPAIPVISEEDESGHRADRPQRYWLVDPIDGTASYAENYDGFVTQVALMEDGGPVLAAIEAPALGLSYLAERSAGAAMNGRRLSTENRADDHTLCLTDNHPEPRGRAAEAYRALGFGRYLESGSIALKICRVADGSADLFFKDVTVRDWDIAAPALVLTEAGGALTDLKGRPFRFAGSFDNPGLVATRDSGLAERFHRWREAQWRACA